MGSKIFSHVNCRDHDCKINEMIGVSLAGWQEAPGATSPFWSWLVWCHLVAVVHFDFNINGDNSGSQGCGIFRTVMILGFFWLVNTTAVA